MGNIDDIIVGKSVVIEELKKLIYAVAKTPTTVLVQGDRYRQRGYFQSYP